jgi:hypothetical protein
MRNKTGAMSLAKPGSMRFVGEPESDGLMGAQRNYENRRLYIPTTDLVRRNSDRALKMASGMRRRLNRQGLSLVSPALKSLLRLVVGVMLTSAACGTQSGMSRDKLAAAVDNGGYGNAGGGLMAANNLSDVSNPQATATNLGLKFYTDNCRPALPNDGVHDDAANLRACMATMPVGTAAEMIFDGTKPYYFSSHSSSDPLTSLGSNWGGNLCETYLRSQQTLNLNGATIVQSNTEAAAGAYAICAGANDQNTPNSGAFYPISATGANAQSITLATPTNASNFPAGTFGYIDCGQNNSDDDKDIGWFEVAAPGGNSSTGLVPLAYQLIKPYNASYDSQCSGGPGPRIYRWNANSPMAIGTTIENGTLVAGSGGLTSMIAFSGNAYGAITGITEYTAAQFIFGNNNHLSTFNHDVVKTPGCGGDTYFNPGEFTSSLNDLEFDKCVATGAGCASSQFERCFGDSEGDEANYYLDDISTLETGGSPNASSSCLYTANSYGDIFDAQICDSAYQGFTDPSAFGQSGSTTVRNSNFSCGGTGCVLLEGPYDQFIDNYVVGTGGQIDVYVPGSGNLDFPVIEGNTIIQGGASAGAFGAMYFGNADPAYTSKVIGNNLFCQALTGCSSKDGIELGGPASNSACTAAGAPTSNCTANGAESSTLQAFMAEGNYASGFGANYSPTSNLVGEFPEAKITGNPGWPNQNPDACQGTIALSASNGTVSETCIPAGCNPQCTDQSTSATASSCGAATSAGSFTVYGTSGHTIAWSCPANL